MSASAIALSSGRGTLFFMICKKNVIGKTKQQNIFGNRVGEGIENIIAAIAFWIPMTISDFSKWKTIGLIVQIILVILGIAYTCYAIYYTCRVVRNPFNKDRLHPHSIVLIKDNLEGAFAFEKVHEKYSVSAKENRCYRHRFYQFLIKEFNEEIEQDSFEIDGKKFYWMSIAEMEQDKRIMEVNSDIVSMVKKVA